MPTMQLHGLHTSSHSRNLRSRNTCSYGENGKWVALSQLSDHRQTPKRRTFVHVYIYTIYDVYQTKCCKIMEWLATKCLGWGCGGEALRVAWQVNKGKYEVLQVLSTVPLDMLLCLLYIFHLLFLYFSVLFCLNDLSVGIVWWWWRSGVGGKICKQ